MCGLLSCAGTSGDATCSQKPTEIDFPPHLKAAFPWNWSTARSSASTEPLSKGAYGTRHRRTVQSVLHETAALPSRVTDTPLTAFVCPA